MSVAKSQATANGASERILPGPPSVSFFTTRPWTHEIEINQHVLNDVSYPTLCGLKPDIPSGPKSANTESGLLDHVVGAGEQRWWDRET
jgi:hypothetical protein